MSVSVLTTLTPLTTLLLNGDRVGMPFLFNFFLRVPEITHHCADAPFILLGTKMDLRDDAKVIESMQRRHKRGPITEEEGKQCGSEVGAALYMECSALTLKACRLTIFFTYTVECHYSV